MTRSPEHAALDDEQRVGAGEVTQHLGHRGGVAVHEGDAGRADQHLLQVRQTGALGRQADQRVLVDLVLAAAGSQRPAQTGQILDLEAPVLGQDGGAGVVEPLPYFVDDRHLLRSRVIQWSPPPSRVPSDAWTAHPGRGALSPRQAGPRPASVPRRARRMSTAWEPPQCSGPGTGPWRGVVLQESSGRSRPGDVRGHPGCHPALHHEGHEGHPAAP